MTKQMAIEALKQGAKIQHRYFSDNEWVTINEDGKYIFEDGVICSPTLFWYDRDSIYWETDWNIFNEEKQTTL
jgi:hypothetical protein